jgi:predicted ATPase
VDPGRGRGLSSANWRGDKAAYTNLTDRGVPDTLGYSRLIGRYAPMVFVAPPWQEIYETDGERKQDFAEAERTYQTVVEVYGECGYETLEVPRTTPLARAQFILAATATRT